MHVDLNQTVAKHVPAPLQEVTLLIADVAALTGIPAPQLRSWEQAGLLSPRRSPNAVRLYGVEDVARARLIKRSLINPGRRGSLRRLAAQLNSGAIRPEPEDYTGLVDTAAGPMPLSESLYWQAVVDSIGELVAVCDVFGRLTYANTALRSMLALGSPATPEHSNDVRLRSAAGEPLPAALETLPLRWSARTGTHHHGLELLLPERGATGIHTRWNVTPLRGADGLLHGAVAVGSIVDDSALEGREDWLAIAAHDLRGPVTTILGRIQLARSTLADITDAGGEASAQIDDAVLLDRHLSTAELGTLDLIRTMETFLDASAANAGVLVQQLEPEGVAFDVLACQAVATAQARSSHHQISLEGATTPLRVAGDPIRLRQVLDNVLVNALKYSPDGGTITVQLSALATLPEAEGASLSRLRYSDGEPHWLQVRITDNGLGIPAEALPRVFDRYWRAEGPTRRLVGTGLGLYACRAIVAAHGGHIWVERSIPASGTEATTSTWHGTTVSILLPLEPGSMHGAEPTTIDMSSD